ncbi:MAG: N-acetyltransferase GCN5 [Chitinophagaceae bacterium]|nr:MAG: N-acetyltransferase GCN5 [Chitinophagaceae bacterium]
MDIQIRRAEQKDCKRILELIQELADFEKAPNEVTVSLAHFEESGFGANPVWWAFVAEETYPTDGMYLEDILVTEKMRGKQIGKQLFNQLIVEAKERDLKGIVWQVLEWNTPAIEFYKKYNASFDPEWINCSIGPDQL